MAGAQFDGTPKQAAWARAVMASFAEYAVARDTLSEADTVALGVYDSALIIKHRESLEQGNARPLYDELSPSSIKQQPMGDLHYLSAGAAPSAIERRKHLSHSLTQADHRGHRVPIHGSRHKEMGLQE